jgi:hypothetical protein
LVSLYN